MLAQAHTLAGQGEEGSEKCEKRKEARRGDPSHEERSEMTRLVSSSDMTTLVPRHDDTSPAT